MISPVPWRYRIVTRQTVPILIGLTGLLALLIALGYFFAREQIINTVNAQLRQFGNSILREDTYNREWLTRSMPVFLQQTEEIFSQKSFNENTLSDKIVAALSEARGRMLVEILTLPPNDSPNKPHNAQNLRVRLYDNKGRLLTHTNAQNLADLYSKNDLQSVQKAYWPVPLIDGERMLHLRYSAPIKDRSGITYGILTTSLAIPWFMERIRSFSFFKQCIPFFLTKAGRWTLPSAADKELENLKTYMLEGRGKFLTIEWEEKRYVAISLASAESSLLIGVLIPYADLFGYLDIISKTLVILGLIVLLLAAYALSKTCNTMLSPLGYLAQTAERLSQGKIEPLTQDPNISNLSPETKHLLIATKQLSTALNQRMHDLTVMAQTRERMHGELALARTIQNSLRPASLPHMPNVETAAAVHAAREVCGDMYDCFLLSEHEICCVIGNVSEHGMPAALMTNRIMPLLHELLLSKLSPAEALENVNASFNNDCPTHKNPLIVVFIGILNNTNGHLRFASAGQFPPFIINGQDNKDMPYQHLTNSEDKALGISEQKTFTNMDTYLDPMQTLFFIPERLTTLQNTHGQSYGQAGIKNFLRTATNSPQALLDEFYQDVSTYTDGNLYDDMVLFALQWLGDKGKEI